MIMIFQGRLRMMQGEESAESRIWLKFSTFLLLNQFHQVHSYFFRFRVFLCDFLICTILPNSWYFLEMI
jgi:hypothetical protein